MLRRGADALRAPREAEKKYLANGMRIFRARVKSACDGACGSGVQNLKGD
jgi:hypothetical protein